MTICDIMQRVEFMLYSLREDIKMRATGYVRKLDSLGRIVLPKSLRKELNINEGDDIEMYVDDDGNVVLDKYVPRCVFCDVAKEDVINFKGKIVCRDCLKDM
jgi:transcriptional pleiotropic regulator of transition state genes